MHPKSLDILIIYSSKNSDFDKYCNVVDTLTLYIHLLHLHPFHMFFFFFFETLSIRKIHFLILFVKDSNYTQTEFLQDVSCLKNLRLDPSSSNSLVRAKIACNGDTDHHIRAYPFDFIFN